MSHPGERLFSASGTARQYHNNKRSTTEQSGLSYFCGLESDSIPCRGRQGFAVGASGTVLKTLDGGFNWFPVLQGFEGKNLPEKKPRRLPAPLVLPIVACGSSYRVASPEEISLELSYRAKSLLQTLASQIVHWNQQTPIRLDTRTLLCPYRDSSAMKIPSHQSPLR